MVKLHFKNIEDLHSYFGVERPENPLFSILHKETEVEESCVSTPLEQAISITNEFYSVSLKNIVAGELSYGRTKYDTSNGTMLFTAPGQTLVFRDLVVSKESYSIYIHKDFVRGHDIYDRLKRYSFFNYNVNEALHLTPREEDTIKSIFKTIKTEYHNNQDSYSKEIIISQLETLLKYSDRFYNRQFLNRKELSGSLIERLNQQMVSYAEMGHLSSVGIPSIDFLADKLDVSSRYLSDTLKKETGKSTTEHIQLFLIDTAKNRLLDPNTTVSEVAYDLGFEYPQYFSRVFKKKVGVSPSDYISRNRGNKN